MGFDVDTGGDEIKIGTVDDQRTWREFHSGGTGDNERREWQMAGLITIVTRPDDPRILAVNQAFALTAEEDGWLPDEFPYRVVMEPLLKLETKEGGAMGTAFHGTKFFLEPRWGGYYNGGVERNQRENV